MKHLYILNLVCIIFITNYDYCKNNAISYRERKNWKLKKLKQLITKQGDLKEKIKTMDKLSSTEEGEERSSDNLAMSNSQWSHQWHLVC